MKSEISQIKNSDYSSLIPEQLSVVSSSLSEPNLSFYNAQLVVIKTLDSASPGLMEAQCDTVLHYLDNAIAFSSPEEAERIARSGSLLISHQIFLMQSIALWSANSNNIQLLSALEDFVSNMVNDICVTVMKDGQSFNTAKVIFSIMDSVKKRFEKDGARFFKKMISGLFRTLKAKTIHKEFLDSVFRIIDKAARRRYFSGYGEHLVDILKRYESEIIELSVKRALEGKSKISSSQRTHFQVIAFLPALLAILLFLILTGLGSNFFGYLWRFIVCWIIGAIVSYRSRTPLYSYCIRKATENRISHIYENLEGSSVLIGHR